MFLASPILAISIVPPIDVLRFLREGSDKRPPSGQQFVQPVTRMSGNMSEDVSQPGLRIHAVHFGRDDRGIHRGGALPAAIRPSDQP